MREVSLRGLARGQARRPTGSRCSRSGSTGTTTRATRSSCRGSSGSTRCLLRLPDARIPRGIGFRAFIVDEAAAAAARCWAAPRRRYRNLLPLDFDQLAALARRRP